MSHRVYSVCSSPDELRPTTDGGDSPVHSQLLPMTRIDPAELTLSDWQAESICRVLAALIANQAVENPVDIPDRLLAAYHDALQLRRTMSELVKATTNSAMEEVTNG